MLNVFLANIAIIQQKKKKEKSNFAWPNELQKQISGLQMAVAIKLVNHTIASYLYCPKWHYNYLGLSAKGKGIANMNKYEIS